MKTIARFAIGLASSVLAAAGMMQAAQRLDPVSRALGNEIRFNSKERPGEACTVPCAYRAVSAIP